MDHIISISSDGTVRTLYTERIDLRDFGPLKIERASNVEYDNDARGWIVIFTNRFGHDLGSRYLARFNDGPLYPSFDKRYAAVFDTREEALASEVDYLQERLSVGRDV